MKNKKPKILFVGEASYLNTGYSVYAREVLSRLYNTGKYEIAELGCYGRFDNPKCSEVPWRFYGNLPTDQEMEPYHSSVTNQFGEWKFNEVLLHFKPDVVLDIRDWWMFDFENRSPLRPYFNWTIMPTVDSAPQQEAWIATYSDADAVFTYSEFGRDTLMEEGGNTIKFKGIASPAINPNVFKPLPNKNLLRQHYGIKQDAFIIGTVMRNQKRKLYPDLIEAFAQLLESNPTLKSNTYLYIHTSYPDIGWDLPRLIKESTAANNILLTYVCQQCRNAFTSIYRDARGVCPRCGQISASLPNTQTGIPDTQLAEIYNLFDVYVQYSICEGFGIPQIEAGACGIPVMAVDYSAMSNVVRDVKGFPIKVQRLFRESETHALRAYPDNQDLIQQLIKIINLPKNLRLKKSRETHVATLKKYTWDKTARVWEKYLDSLELVDKWNDEPRIFQSATQMPNGMDNETFVKWAIINILGEPEKCVGFFASRLVRDLNYEATMIQTGGSYVSEDSAIGVMPRYRPFKREDCIKLLQEMCENRNYWERRRVGMIEVPPTAAIRFCKMEE